MDPGCRIAPNLEDVVRFAGAVVPDPPGAGFVAAIVSGQAS